MLTLRNIYKSYGSQSVLNNLELDLRRGELLGLIGPNGAGKSTLLRIVLNLEDCTGDIRIDDQPNTLYLKNRRSSVFYVPETLFLYPFLSGDEFVRFIADMQGLAYSEIADKADLLFKLFDLEDARHKLIKTYSLGMCRKTYLIAAFVQTPSLLILDEPVSGVDARSIIVFKQLLRRLAAAGTTVILTTHIIDVIENLCDSVAILHDRTIAYRQSMADTGRDTIERIYLDIIGDDIGDDVGRFGALLQ